MQPLVSIIIPVYNGEKYIAQAIESVFRQNHPHVEVIVVNDGSTDGTLATLERFGEKVRIISQENKGQAVARNVGIKLAHGSIIGLLDADDMWPDNHLGLMLPHLLEGDYDFARGYTRYVKNSGTEVEEMTQNLFMEALVGACLYKASVFTTVGLFDETMRQGEDFDWNIRLIESACKEKRINETTLLYRRHESNLTNSKECIEKGQIHAFRNKVMRARNRKNNE